MSVEKELDPEHYRDNPTAIANYLTEVIEKNDLEILVRAIGNVMRAQNVRHFPKRRAYVERTFRGCLRAIGIQNSGTP
jgi:DNA-binding phage protein